MIMTTPAQLQHARELFGSVQPRDIFDWIHCSGDPAGIFLPFNVPLLPDYPAGHPDAMQCFHPVLFTFIHHVKNIASMVRGKKR